MSPKSVTKGFSAFALGLVMSMAVSAAGAGQTTISCGSAYTIRPGDTLFKVADRAYADGHLYTRIYQANRDFLPDEASVEIGDQLLIPCLDGTGPQTRTEAVASGLISDRVRAAAAAAWDFLLASRMQLAPQVIPASSNMALAGTTVAVPGPAATDNDMTHETRIRLISGGDSAPYSGQALPEGGMITEMLARALEAAAPARDFQVTFVANNSAHVENLLTDGAFDIAFPWFRPDCGDPSRLDREAQDACEDFEFSAPIVEIVFGYYARAGDPVAQIGDVESLRGKRLCMPQGRFLSDPSLLDESELQILTETAQSPRDCFRRLVDGQVDLVQMVKPDAPGTLRSMGLAGEVAEIQALESRRTLHAVVARSSARGRANLALIDRGLRQLMSSGAWFEIVARHQSARLALNY